MQSSLNDPEYTGYMCTAQPSLPAIYMIQRAGDCTEIGQSNAGPCLPLRRLFFFFQRARKQWNLAKLLLLLKKKLVITA